MIRRPSKFPLVKLLSLPSAAAVLLSGCANLLPVPVADAPVEVAEVAPPATPEPAPAPAPRRVAPEPPPKPVHTAVLLTADIPAFAAIADEIRLRMGVEHVSIHNLEGNPGNAATIGAEVAGADQLIAIGLLAASVGRKIENTRMVFCQVFNYQDYDLISASSKGVNMLPPFDLQLDSWLSLDPELKSIGIITGPGQESLVEEIRAATSARQIELSVRTVQSDKEALYDFKRLTPEIQGLWLLPDNRILSPEVVREMMSYSARHRKQVVVFGDGLLDLGALMSVTSDPTDIAEQVIKRLASGAKAKELPGPDMQALTTLHVEINPDVARRLGLPATPQLAQSLARDQ